MEKPRCRWVGQNPDMIEYHDSEWGVPCRDDGKLFEFLLLDTFQAGLSWQGILLKRAGLRRAFADFNPEAVAKFNEADIERLMQDSSIIRNRAKIRSAISNAQAFLRVQAEFGSFSAYLWSFVDDRPVVNQFAAEGEIPAKTDLSERISQALKERAFSFVGPTIVYAYLQGAGLVNDHLVNCFRYNDLVST